MADQLSDSPSLSQNNSAAQGPQRRKKPRNRKQGGQHNQSLDGTVSDGVLPKIQASPRATKGHNPRQSVGTGSGLPNPNGQQDNGYDHMPRAVSSGAGFHATPSKEQAYAGATFQSSPAPSSLPVPRFFSKSVPNVAAQPSLQARLAGESTSDRQDSSPEQAVKSMIPPSRNTQQSPLDLFFKAARAEREKGRSASNLSLPTGASQQQPNIGEQGRKSTLLSELDGKDSSSSSSPRTALSQGHLSPQVRPHSSPGIRSDSTHGEGERLQSQTDSLKALLFNTAATASTPPPLMRTVSGPSTPHSASGTPPSLQRQASGTPPSLQRQASGPPSPHTPAENQRNYSLHYGNRNLSPLFKAARTETPTRPSGLRQEFPANQAASTPLPMEFHSIPAPAPPPSQNGGDARARQYLHQQLRASAPAEIPQLPFAPRNDSSTGFPPPVNNNNNNNNGPRPAVAGPERPVSSASPRTGNSVDNKALEDNLRRLLKIN